MFLVSFILLKCPIAFSGQNADSPDDALTSSQNIKSLQEKLSAQTAKTTSGFEEDEIFRTDEGYNLDQYLFRSGSPIRFPINITRVFSKNKKDYAQLIVGQPELVLSVWDVDAVCGTACGGCCEVDKVYINGNFVGVLKGANNSWTEFRFPIPVSWFEEGKVKDATYIWPGVDPAPGENWITIDIDTACGSCWAVQCDYGKIEMKGMRPAVLIHGIRSDSQKTWTTFKQFIPGDLSEAFDVLPEGDTFVNSYSIRTNYLPSALQGFGVKKVNFICHSKGGLDTSDAIRGNANKVDNLITLGSPLLGTEYADHFINDHSLLSNSNLFLSKVVSNALSTSTRAKYYQDHPPKDEDRVRDHYFAGVQYGPTDTTCIVKRYLQPWHNAQIFNGTNDGWVPVNRSFPIWRSSPDKTGLNSHTDDPGVQPKTPGPPNAMTSDPAVGAWAVSLMKSSVVGASARLAIVQQEKPKTSLAQKSVQQPRAVSGGPQQTSGISASLVLGETRTFDVPIDSSVKELRFYIAYDPGGVDVQVALIKPVGARINLTRVPDFPGFSYVAASPALGIWKVEVHANDAVLVQGATELVTTLNLSASTNKAEYAAGEAMQIAAHLERKGNPLSGAVVNALLTNLNGFSDSLPLADKGNGDYVGNYTPPTGGVFTIQVVANGSVSGRAFQRAAYIPMITVAPSTASVIGVVSELANDTDGNGLYNNLTLEVNLQVQTEGDYLITGVLEDSTGTFIANAAASPHLLPGSQNIQLVFDGNTIRSSEKDGPYNLARVIIYDIGSQGLITNAKTNVYSTQPYSFFNFEGPILGFGSGIDYGTDSDGDGFYNSLTIELKILVAPGYAGSYTFNAQLQDSNGIGIEWYSNPSQNLNVGVNTIQLIYPGGAIATSKLAGPYRVGNFLLYNLNNSTIRLSTSNAYTTGPYQFCQFQGAEQGSETGLCNDGLDNDCDGLIDCDDPDCQGATNYIKGTIMFGKKRDKANLNIAVSPEFCGALPGVVTVKLSGCDPISIPVAQKGTTFRGKTDNVSLKIDCRKNTLTLSLKGIALKDCVENPVKTCISADGGHCICAKAVFTEKVKKGVIVGLIYP